MMELTARVEALSGAPAERSEGGPRPLRLRRRGRRSSKAEVTRGKIPVELSAREFKLLKHFIENRGATLSREELLSRVWGYDAAIARAPSTSTSRGCARRSSPTPRGRSTW